ncbi:MAG TPA: hypothetical protein VMZ91_00330 [Candidatus Paceibacterota bacterium]|nr:hypothetical protein [Candidatus Paceibacterota bacterium]
MNIKIKINEKEVLVDKEDYIVARTKDLKEFGYSSITEDDVRLQLDKIFKGEVLSVIGLFIEDDIIKK